MCLLESKLSFVDEAIGRSVFRARGWKWKVLPANGVSGGTGIYGPGEGGNRNYLWRDIQEVREAWGASLDYWGDFNTVLYPSERSEARQDSST